MNTDCQAMILYPSKRYSPFDKNASVSVNLSLRLVIDGRPLHLAHMALIAERQEDEVGARRITASFVLETLGVLSAVATLALGVLGTLPEDPEFEVGREVFGNIPAPVVVLFYLWVAVYI